MKQRFGHFWRELRRRRVLHSVGFYLAGCWLLLQVVDVALVEVGFPDYTMALAVWLVVIALPVVILVSWRYDITRRGVKRTPPAGDETGADLSLKRIDHLVIPLVLLFVLGVSAMLTRVLDSQEPENPIREAKINSIAVLPFENLSGRPEDQYMARGLAEDILHRLALIQNLHVASRTSSFELQTQDLDITAIGERLGVASLIDGSVRKDGDQLRIVVQLIDAVSGYHRWSGSYDREMRDLFGIYDEISSAVAAELQLTLLPESTPPTGDIEAYDYFLQARSMQQKTSLGYDSFRMNANLTQTDALAVDFFDQAQGVLQTTAGAEGAASAHRFFSKAVERDPGFAQAWAGQCQALMDWYYYQPEKQKIEMAEASCRKALELDPELSLGRVALGDLLRKTGWIEQSIEEYLAALASHDGLAPAWLGLGEAYGAQERDREAEEAFWRAIELDPDDLRSYYALGAFLFKHGRYQEAASVYEELAAHPYADVSAYNGQAVAYYMMEDFERAAQSYRKVIATAPTDEAYSNVGTQYYYNGQFEDAVVMYEQAVALAPSNPVWWGNLGDALQQTDGGIAAAREAYREAAELAGEMLQDNPEDAENLTNLAHFHARLGEDQMARMFLDRALTAAPHDVYVYYYAALVHLEAGRKQQALQAIRRSVELGYPTGLLKTDPQFEALGDSESLRLIIESADIDRH